MKSTNIIVLVFILITNTICHCQNSYTYSQPKTLEDGWKTGNLIAQEIDTTLINTLFSQLYGRTNKIHSVLLIKDHQLIIEEYFNGHSINKPHDLRSITKSIRSILMGIAIDKGFINSINDPITKYLKTHQPKKNIDPRKRKITIKHLLTMSSGLDCNDWDKKSKGQEDKVHKKRDWIQYTLDLPMVYEPGEVANYCSMGTVVLAAIISQASGLTIDKFAEKYLFTPLEITKVHWSHTTSNKKIIPSAKRVYITSRGMAKIGQLILNNGTWKGKQIVSEEWIVASTSPKTKITKIDYGYLWWNIPFKAGKKIITSKTATGNGGQYIMILPELDMVAVFTGGAYNSQEDKLPFAILNDIFIPTFTKKKK